MLSFDVNICGYAMRPDACDQPAAVAEWVADVLNGNERVGITSLVLSAMTRFTTKPRMFAEPARPEPAPPVCHRPSGGAGDHFVSTGVRHRPIFADLVSSLRIRGDDVPDAFLAALALESGATMVTGAAGFRRFAPLRILDPLA